MSLYCSSHLVDSRPTRHSTPCTVYSIQVTVYSYSTAQAKGTGSVAIDWFTGTYFLNRLIVKQKVDCKTNKFRQLLFLNRIRVRQSGISPILIYP
jgi:hypothetical protein